ncbi:MAG: hypothetical protein KIT25_10790 [Enhydrobacter sp.]|nr:MAG: hypothetical protein KIT25_10790 [Enhydrobacter sp.]
MSTLRFVVAALAALLLASGGASAQGRPSQDQLARMTTQALADPETVRFARPQILGFEQAVITHQLGYESGDFVYYFAVTKPRLNDGLVFFTHQKSTNMFRMHRTDTHLRRVASARNDMKTDAGLVVWAGQAADADFAAQLAYWSGFR